MFIQDWSRLRDSKDSERDGLKYYIGRMLHTDDKSPRVGRRILSCLLGLNTLLQVSKFRCLCLSSTIHPDPQLHVERTGSRDVSLS